jgi:hypothetical protein
MQQTVAVELLRTLMENRKTRAVFASSAELKDLAPEKRGARAVESNRYFPKKHILIVDDKKISATL